MPAAHPTVNAARGRLRWAGKSRDEIMAFMAMMHAAKAAKRADRLANPDSPPTADRTARHIRRASQLATLGGDTVAPVPTHQGYPPASDIPAQGYSTHTEISPRGGVYHPTTAAARESMRELRQLHREWKEQPISRELQLRFLQACVGYWLETGAMEKVTETAMVIAKLAPAELKSTEVTTDELEKLKQQARQMTDEELEG